MAFSASQKGLLAWLVCLAVLPALLRLPPNEPQPPVEPGGPRLVVLVYFDQLRGDYLTRWENLFGEGGFRRLLREGAWFQNCHYPYASTITGPGHASVATGCSPDRHGIVGNDWYDRTAAENVYCVGSEHYRRIPPVDEEPGTENTRRKGSSSPERLLAPTIADALKKATGGRAKVISLSWKDRSAVLPAGRRPDACYWIDFNTGTFVTSTYYRDELHRWVQEYNRGRPADQWYGTQWTHLRPDLDYERYSGPDDMAGEGKGVGQGRVFPHPLNGGPKGIKAYYYAALYNSPFGNDLLLGLVKRAIDAERLGTQEVPDLLIVSFSCNDPIGHTWGPDSQEVLDVTLRSDGIVKELLDHLDARVGRGRYVLALTADHGVCPLPEVSRRQGKEALRIAPSLLEEQAEEFLNEQFGGQGDKVRWVEGLAVPWIYLSRQTLRQRGATAATAAAALAGWLQKQQGVQAAYTRTQLTQGVAENDVVGRRVQRSFHFERCGDVYVLLRPYYLLSSPLATGTTHGTPHPYDTHVPLLVYGSGIHSGVHEEAVTPQATAAILARALRIEAPAGAEAPVPQRLFDVLPR